MAISFVVLVTLVSCRNEAKKMARPSSVILIVMCCAQYPPTPPLRSSFRASSVSSLFVMPKVDPRNEVGAIVHAVLNRVLSDHTAKNIYGNVNYAKTFLQGTVINVFDGRTSGGGECRLEVDGGLRDALRRTYTQSRIKEGRRPSEALHPRAGSVR